MLLYKRIYEPFLYMEILKKIIRKLGLYKLWMSKPKHCMQNHVCLISC